MKNKLLGYFLILPFLMVSISAQMLAQRTIVTIGDSNGASDMGWVNKLKSIRTQDSIFNYSISGNTIGFDNLDNEKLNTLKNIHSYIKDASLRSKSGSLDDIIILLGTNDCKKVFENQAEQAIQNLEKLIELIKEQIVIKSSEPVIYIVTPPPFGEDSILLDKYHGGDERVRQLLPGFMKVALEQHCQFIDVYHELKPQFDQLNIDGVHLNEDGSKLIATTISRFLDKTNRIRWEDTKINPWPDDVEIVEIKSPLDGAIQKAYFYATTRQEPQPLIVSLHTWSGDYSQSDPLLLMILAKDWNYIHPDFRGVNNTPKSMGSPYAIDDIEQAISFALQHADVDPKNIHVIGASGGGYATLYTYLHSKHPVASFSAWVPISDIEAWFYQSLGRKNKYAEDIMAATGSVDSVLNSIDARKRSPIFMETPVEKRRQSQLTIYAGIHDGYEGSVPVSQSINFYNKIIKDYDSPDSVLVSEQEIQDLLSMRYYPEVPGDRIDSRPVIFKRSYKNISLILFEGNHEMLADVALELIPLHHED